MLTGDQIGPPPGIVPVREAILGITVKFTGLLGTKFTNTKAGPESVSSGTTAVI
jgi:hypothetical protein